VAENNELTSIQVQKRAMNISLFIGVLMLGIKWTAYALTGSIVIFSDAIETIVHIAAVGFAWYSLRVSVLPPDDDHHFGHGKVSFFSAGLEGALIIVAAVVIVATAIEKMVSGFTLEAISIGAILTASAGVINAALGFYLVRVGKRERSIIVEANGRHVITDAWTSVGAIIGIVAAGLSGWYILDPIFALLFGANIIVEGGKLLRASVNGLMDKTNHVLEEAVRTILEKYCTENDVSYHRLRLRETGQRIYVDFHLEFPDGTPIEIAHAMATAVENEIRMSMPGDAEILSHLESKHLPPNHRD